MQTNGSVFYKIQLAYNLIMDPDYLQNKDSKSDLKKGGEVIKFGAHNSFTTLTLGVHFKTRQNKTKHRLYQ